LKDVFFVGQNYVERRLYGYCELQTYQSEFMGYNITAKQGDKTVYLLTYFDDDKILQINECINEFRVFDILEDYFKEDIILHEN